MRLPGTENWVGKNIDAQIGFEATFGKAAPALLQVMDPVDRDGEERAESTSSRDFSESIFAYGRAAELAFATEHIDHGISICRHLVISERPKTPMQIAFYATVGALIGAVRVHLYPEVAVIERKAPLHLENIELPWPRDDSAYVVT